jgi:hypothetical protein
MSELKRLFPEPRLSPFFAARVMANLPKERPAPKWMRAYWAGLAGLTLVLAPAYLPLWLWYVSVPAGFGLGVAAVELIAGRSSPKTNGL